MDLATIVEQGNPGGNLLPGEPVELDDSGLRAKVERHDLHRLIATVQLDDHPAAMDAIFTAPFHARYEVRAKLLDRSKRLESRVVLVCMGQLDHVSRHAQLPCSGRVYTRALGENQHSGELASIDGFAAAERLGAERQFVGTSRRSSYPKAGVPHWFLQILSCVSARIHIVLRTKLRDQCGRSTKVHLGPVDVRSVHVGATGSLEDR